MAINPITGIPTLPKSNTIMDVYNAQRNELLARQLAQQKIAENQANQNLIAAKIAQMGQPQATDFQVVQTPSGWARINKRTGQAQMLTDAQGKSLPIVQKQGMTLQSTPGGGFVFSSGGVTPIGGQVGSISPGAAVGQSTTGNVLVNPLSGYRGGRNYAVIDKQGNITYGSAPTTAAQTAQQQREAAQAEASQLVPTLSHYLAPYRGLEGRVNLLKDIYLARQGDKNATDRLTQYQAALNERNLAASTTAREGGATQIGSELIGSEREQLFPYLPEGGFNYLIPGNVQTAGSQLGQQILSKAVQSARAQNLTGFPYRPGAPNPTQAYLQSNVGQPPIPVPTQNAVAPTSMPPTAVNRYANFTSPFKNPDFSTQNIIAYAIKNGLDPNVVVKRLQASGKIK